MIGSQLFIHKETGKIESQIPFLDIPKYEQLICDTCKKPIHSNEGVVDDGIKAGVYHHAMCY